MTRIISQMVLAGAVVASLAGCGSGVGGTSRAYADCRDLGLSDSDIQAMLSLVRIGRDEGYSANYVLENVVPACYISECINCLVALVDAVY